MALEINLVPDIKNEMLKAMKIRNYTFFICIIIAAASIATSLIFWSIAAGQQAVADSKKATLTTLSAKVNSYSDLSDFITIKNQLSDLSDLSANRRVFSRIFNVLSALIPTGADTITISRLSVNLESENPKIEFDGQANAGAEPYIDYNVLDSFKKSMQYMRYDYGEYVDRNGDTIPAYCMVENAADGATLYDVEKKSYYALWLIDGEGCNPSAEDSDEDEDVDAASKALTDTEIQSIVGSYSKIEDYNGQRVVRIWRTPQFDDWYNDSETGSRPHMDLDGNISNVPHFESTCISYQGVEKSNGKISWASLNESCKLVPDGAEGMTISSSSNGREDEYSTLVLRFSASITFAPEVFAFSNHHMLALGPTNRVNVTDSYVQIQSIFAKRASDCAEDDLACISSGGGN